MLSGAVQKRTFLFCVDIPDPHRLSTEAFDNALQLIDEGLWSRREVRIQSAL
jgi:hypothetical protein